MGLPPGRPDEEISSKALRILQSSSSLKICNFGTSSSLKLPEHCRDRLPRHYDHLYREHSPIQRDGHRVERVQADQELDR
jgi:hypothetical protein